MKVFVAGASGVIGRSLVPQLVAAGHEVAGMTRQSSKADQLKAAGAEPVICDVFDREALNRELKRVAPDVVINQLTDLPPAINLRRAERDYAGNDRIRTEGAQNLVSAAKAAGVGRMIAQSIAFVYDLTKPGVKTEEDALYENAPHPWSRTFEAVSELERLTTGTEGIRGTALRYGFFYGPGSSYSRDGHFGKEAKRGRLPVIKGAEGVFSFIHIDDAASATVAALEKDATGIYNIVDDEPAPITEWVPAFAAGVGAKPPRTIPKWVARLALGKLGMMFMDSMQPASNAKAKRELGWAPSVPSWREGFRQL